MKSFIVALSSVVVSAILFMAMSCINTVEAMALDNVVSFYPENSLAESFPGSEPETREARMWSPWTYASGSIGRGRFNVGNTDSNNKASTSRNNNVNSNQDTNRTSSKPKNKSKSKKTKKTKKPKRDEDEDETDETSTMSS